jgi:Protein of unknown function (DUF3302)
MEALLGFPLDAWDYATFAAMAIIGAGFLGLLALILGLPGRIAIARHHPEAEAVNMMGWLGFLGVVPWVQAFIWALKPTNVVDIRNLPRDTRRATDEEIARLTGKHVPEAAPPQVPPTEPRNP